MSEGSMLVGDVCLPEKELAIVQELRNLIKSNKKSCIERELHYKNKIEALAICLMELTAVVKSHEDEINKLKEGIAELWIHVVN